MNKELGFQELLKKYIDNKCSAAEVAQLIEYLDQADAPGELPEVEEAIAGLQSPVLLDQEADKRIFNNIIALKKRNRRKRFWKSVVKLSGAAAVFALLLMGYFEGSYDFISSPPEAAPEEITLQLENGSIESLEESNFQTIYDSQGNQVGKLQGNQLVYEANAKSDSLEFNLIKVPYGKTFIVALSDGTEVHLNAGTSFKFPINFLEDRNREVTLVGEAYFDVAHDEERPFIVKAEELNVQVLGTEFNVAAYAEDGESEVVLVEGSVGMYLEGEEFNRSTAEILSPGFQGTYVKSNGSFSQKEVPTSLYTSWTRGELVIRNLSFEQVVKRLERHYNVRIENNKPENPKVTFNANFGNEPIEKVLEYFNRIYNLEYQIEGNEIIIE